jgi:hypothetical protein
MLEIATDVDYFYFILAGLRPNLDELPIIVD